MSKILDENSNGVEKAAAISKLSGNIANIIGEVRQLGGFDKAGTIAPIASAFLGSIGSVISLFDGVEAEEVVDVVQKALESATILAEYALKPEFATTKIGTMLGGNSFVTTKLKPIAETLNANALKINLGVSVALGLVMGGVQYFKSAEQYQIDGLKGSLATKDKWMDAFTTGIKTFYGTVTGELDDVAFGLLSAGASNAVYGIEWLWTKITGGDGKSKKKSSVANSVSGGAGDDVIFIDQTRTANIIFYENGDGNDEIFGYDSNDQIRINQSAYTTQINGDDVKIIVGSGSMTLYDAKDKKLNITRTDVEIMPTGMTADKARTTLTLSNKFKAQNVYLENYGSSFTKVNASGLAATQGIEIIGNASGNSIKGGKGDDIISGEAGNDTIYGGSGNDIISGGTGSNTLSGGEGNDIFVYTGGDDFITDYKAGEDRIKLVSAEIVSADVLGSNIVLTTSAGNITVKGAKNSQITVIDSADVETSQLYGRMNYSADKKMLSLTSAFTGTLDVSDYLTTVKKIDAASTSKAIKIYGNSQANTIFGGKGADTIYGGTGKDSIFGNAGADKLFGEAGNDSLFGEAGNDKLFGEDGNDTLSGGAGSDTLTGGAGKDVFVYGSGDGKDTITDYAENQDKLKITSGEISGYSFSGSSVVFTVGSGTLTVQNGKGKKITITDAKNKTTTKVYSGAVSGRSALWFADDDNFTTNAPALDSILQIKSIAYSTDYIPSTMDFSIQPRDSLSSVPYAQHEITR